MESRVPERPDRGGDGDGSGPRRAVVLGAGLAGLRATLELLDRGYEVELIERLGEPGGMARSHRVDGFLFDHGPHGFFSRRDWIMDEFKELLEDHGGYRWRTKWSQIRYRGHYFNYPLRLKDLVSKMNPATLVAALFSFLWARGRVAVTREEAINAEEYLVDSFGRVFYDEFFGPYTSKVWGVDPAVLAADFTRDRVPSLHLWDVIRKLFIDPARELGRSTATDRVATHELHRFVYPKRGAHALPEAYAEQIRKRGGKFRFGAEATEIDTEQKIVRGKSEEGGFVLPYDGLVSTICLDAILSIISPRAPDEILELAGELQYRGILLVNLCVDRPQVIEPFWIYFTDRFFNRISEYRHFSPDLVPKGKTGICLEVGCDEDDDPWKAEDEEIVRRCLPDLEDLDLLREEDVEGFLVIREPRAYPLYDVGYRDRINRLVGWLEGTAGIMSAGRQGRFVYINQDDAIQAGRDAARALDEALETGVRKARPVWDDRERRKIVG